MSPNRSSLPHSAVNHFLKLRKQAFLSSISNNVRPSIVMGNEAGDLDSLACAISYSYLSSLLTPQQEIYPFIQTERKDLHLRPENQLALETCLIDPENLICIEDLESIDYKVDKLSLVDHCKLSSRFKEFSEEDVEAVIDHHEDEKLYSSANPRRIVAPTTAGSCASVLSLYFKSVLSPSNISDFPPELATLLLSAILIDTHAMDPKVGKAKPEDLGAVGWLYPLSSLSKQDIPESNNPKDDEEDQEDLKDVQEMGFVPTFSDLDSFHEGLSNAKNDVSSLSTVDLIRRDYKEYLHPSANSTSSWVVGLTSVPTSLSAWVSEETPTQFLKGCSEFCSTKNLHLLGILTAFVEESSDRFKREILFYSPKKYEPQSEEVCQKLLGAKELDMEKIEVPELKNLEGSQNGEGWFRIYDQKALKATRKQVAPSVKEACSKVTAPE